MTSSNGTDVDQWGFLHNALENYFTWSYKIEHSCLEDAAVPLLVLCSGSTCTSELRDIKNVPSYIFGLKRKP